MIDPADLRARPETYQEAAKNKGVKSDVLAFLNLDEERRELIQHVDAMRSERNSVSKAVPQMQGDEKAKTIAAMKELGDKLKEEEEKLTAIETEWNALLLTIPNLPLPEVPVQPETAAILSGAGGDTAAVPTAVDSPAGIAHAEDDTRSPVEASRPGPATEAPAHAGTTPTAAADKGLHPVIWIGALVIIVVVLLVMFS